MKFWPSSLLPHLFFFCSLFLLPPMPYSQALSFLHFLLLRTIFCFENPFSRLPNLIFFTFFLKISSDPWVFESFWKTHFLETPFQIFIFFYFFIFFIYLSWNFLLNHLSSLHFMGRDMIHRLSGMIRRDFFKPI